MQKPETSSGRGDAGPQQERHRQAATGIVRPVCRRVQGGPVDSQRGTGWQRDGLLAMLVRSSGSNRFQWSGRRLPSPL
jgi:hypothetical protein